METVIRRTGPADTEALERFYAGLSDESRRRRFCGIPSGISHLESRAFCTPDHAHREGFVAVPEDETGPQEIVGHLCLEPVDATTAEVAIAVADAYQRRGIGHRLMAAGIDWARTAGIQHLTATMLVTNGPIQRLLSSIGLPWTARAEGLDLTILTMDLSESLTAAA